MATETPAAAAKKEKPTEFNPRWKGYIYIAISSAVNFLSISNIPRTERKTYWAAAMAFGALTFFFSLVVLIQDRSQKCISKFHYTKARGGYFEGYALLFTVLWWIIGTAYITKVGGIAYVAYNIYFSSWMCLFSCLYTLNEWSTEKDILSIAELTSISATLKSWWFLFISSLVVMGTSIDLQVFLSSLEMDTSDSVFGVALGVVSSSISFIFILAHYDFIKSVEEGSWLELAGSFFLILLWIISLAVLTQDGGVAATMGGNQCGRDLSKYQNFANCTVIAYIEQDSGEYELSVAPCSDATRQIPGSNLYFSVWASFLGALNVSLRWKAAQALQFAQTRQEKQRQQLAGTGEQDEGSRGSNDDEDEM